MNNKKIDINDNTKPFLRWAGGKRWFTKYLDNVNNLKVNNYYEPFLGGGAVFFSLNNFKKAYLSDLNPDLIETYKCIRDKPEKIISFLKTFYNSENEYYKIRDIIYENDYQRAARFIYLNRTSFNGIYRVNQLGKFNVPYGKRKNIDLVDSENIYKVSKKLKNTIINHQDFELIYSKIKEHDLVFLDPPYTVAHENNGFIQYNQKIFSLGDQERLAKFIQKIKNKGAYYILTNAKHQAILDIYREIDFPITLTRSSTVGGSGARREGFNEYIFSNCLNIKF